jgi:hypothetical protein
LSLIATGPGKKRQKVQCDVFGKVIKVRLIMMFLLKHVIIQQSRIFEYPQLLI